MVTIEAIKNVLTEANVGCSTKQIAILLKIDAPSEVLRGISEVCWESVEAGELVCLTNTLTDQQFFSVV